MGLHAELKKLPFELGNSLRHAYKVNLRLGAFTTIVTPQEALEASKASTERGAAMAGVSVGVKDIFCTRDLPTSAASRMLKGYMSPFDATVVERLRDSGAIVVGKTNMDEFGMGSENRHSYFGPTRNPAGPDLMEHRGNQYSQVELDWGSENFRVTGGSSGGSAAAVAAGLCDVALASDTGGSTRLPAAYCGIVGLKPSYGLLSRWGMLSYASSLDCVGIMARTVGEVRTTFRVLSEYDEKDPTSAPEDARVRSKSREGWTPRASPTDLTGLKIGVPAEFFLEELSPNVLPSFRRVLEEAQAMGATLHSVSIPSTPISLSAYYVIASAEASSNLARYDGVRFGFRSQFDMPSTHVEGDTRLPLYSATRSEGFGKEVKKRILLGTHALSAEAFDNYYLQAHRIRSLLRSEFDAVFLSPSPLLPPSSTTTTTPKNAEGVDVLLHPSAISTAPLLYPQTPPSPTAGYVQDILNVPASLAGLPAMSVPSDRAEDGWPVGVQVVGQWGSDEVVLAVGEALELTLEVKERWREKEAAKNAEKKAAEERARGVEAEKVVDVGTEK